MYLNIALPGRKNFFFFDYYDEDSWIEQEWLNPQKKQYRFVTLFYTKKATYRCLGVISALNLEGSIQ